MTTTEQAKQVAQRLSDYDNDGVTPQCCIDGSDTIDALVAKNTRLSALADKWNLGCDELREDNKRLATESEKLHGALKIAAASNAWQNFGSCRDFGGDFKTPAEVDAIARAALGEKS